MTPLEDRSSKHTAGPWAAKRTIRAHDGFPAVWQIDGESDAVCTTQFCYAPETAANARLIAAAPALLEALRKVHMSAVIIPAVPTEAALSVNVLKEVDAALRLATEPTNER